MATLFFPPGVDPKVRVKRIPPISVGIGKIPRRLAFPKCRSTSVKSSQTSPSCCHSERRRATERALPPYPATGHLPATQ
jgi:hypothetical protein